MFKRGKQQVQWQLPYVDFLFAVGACFAALFMASLIQVNPSKNDANAQRNAEVMVILEWTDDLCDVDLSVKDPTGAVVYYQDKVRGLAHLEFDDRGNVNSQGQTVDGTKVVSLDHKEYWVIRGIIPGTYKTSAHLFTCRGKDGDAAVSWPHGFAKEVKVKMTIEDLNPSLVIADVRELVMHKIWDEAIGADFDIASDGSIMNIQDGSESLVSKLVDAAVSGSSFPGSMATPPYSGHP